MLVAVRIGRAAQAGDVYDFLASAVRGLEPDFVERVRAFVAPLDVWRTVPTVERCGLQVHAWLVQRAWYDQIPGDVRAMLRESAEIALALALRVPPQLTELAGLAKRQGIELMVLKGAARLIQGELAGIRTVTDIDVLTREGEARRLHDLLRSEMGYLPLDLAPAHHLAPLTLKGAHTVEIHTRPTRRPSVVAESIWRDAREVTLGSASVLVPSADALVLHTLEHALANRAWRYRLRDIVDVAAVWADDVDADVLLARIAGSADREPLEVLLSAAHELEPRVPRVREESWHRVRRVARARVAAACAVSDTEASDLLMLVAATIAEGSPREIARLCGRGLAEPGLVARTLRSLARGRRN